ncbi:MAG: hypothetical protein M3161_06235, partial [Actinomycetota bacterium]|nr:hypothetical protein [Actinomycetota bacterium]
AHGRITRGPGSARQEESALQRVASVTARLERRVSSQSGGVYGAVTNAASAFSNRTERVVFQRGIESLLERVSAVLAELTERVEERVFQLGPGRVAALGDRIRNGLLAIEAFVGRPVVAGLVAMGCLIAIALSR